MTDDDSNVIAADTPDERIPSVVTAGIDILPESVAVLDSSGQILLVNEPWHGFAADNGSDHPTNWVGENYLAVCEEADSQRATAVADGLNALLDGETESFRLEYPCHSPGTSRWFVLRAAAFTHDGATYLCLSHADVTEQKVAEMQAEARANQLEKILGVLSHDIRNPVNVIEGFLPVLEAEVDDTDALEHVQRATDRIAEIAETTLSFIRTGGLSEVEPIHLSEIATDAWETVATDDAELRTPGTVTFQGDPALLRQLFENLFRNAIEHAGPDCTVTVGPLPDGFYVADDGPGLPPEVRGRIRASEFSSEGAGLGLEIVSAVTEAHGADLQVSAGETGGARFEVRGVDVDADDGAR